MTGKYDSRNKLNDLTGKEWLLLTKSYWVSQKCVEDKFAFKHPAPFLIKDIEKLISLFTKKGMTVLDPFCGVGTTLVACQNLSRNGIGVELNREFVDLTVARFAELGFENTPNVFCGDSAVVLDNITQQIDYCVTSPPYHNILRNKGDGIRVKKVDKRSGAREGVDFYSDDPRDLGNQETYESFLELFGGIMVRVFSLLKPGGYTSIVISDFTVLKKEVNVQGDIVRIMSNLGYEFSGTIALLQDNKPLYPFGYPYAYKINHHHQNIINFRKPQVAKAVAE